MRTRKKDRRDCALIAIGSLRAACSALESIPEVMFNELELFVDVERYKNLERVIMKKYKLFLKNTRKA